MAAPRYIRNRSQASASCWWVTLPNGRRVPEHVVTPNEGGWFDVLSSRSGETYRVSTDGECSRTDGTKCPGFATRHTCSHLEAVLAHARKVLGKE
jgi:hypothetical protein